MYFITFDTESLSIPCSQLTGLTLDYRIEWEDMGPGALHSRQHRSSLRPVKETPRSLWHMRLPVKVIVFQLICIRPVLVLFKINHHR